MTKKLVSAFLIITMLLSLGSISIFASPDDRASECVNESAYVEQSHKNDNGLLSFVKYVFEKAVLITVIGAAGYIIYNVAYDQGNAEGLKKGLSEGFSKGRSEIIKNYLANCKIHEEILSHIKKSVSGYTSAVSECTLGDIASGTIKGVKYGSSAIKKYGFPAIKYGSSELMKLAKEVVASVRGENLVDGIADTLWEIS